MTASLHLQSNPRPGVIAFGMILSLLGSIFLIDWFADELRILPYIVSWLPDVLSTLAVVVIVAQLSASSQVKIPPRYVILFIAFTLVVIAGWVLNSSSPGTVIAGTRFYFRYVPFFLLPLVFQFADEDIQVIYKWVLGFFALQIIVVSLQKFAFGLPPDRVSGTVGVGSTLSFLLVSGICIALAGYLKNIISLRLFLGISLLLFYPTTINETKATLVLLPAGCIAVVFAIVGQESKRESSKVLAKTLGFIGILSVGFFVMYSLTLEDYYGVDEEGNSKRNLIEFFSTSKGAERYLYTGEASQVDPSALLGEKESKIFGQLIDPNISQSRTRRIDTIVLPYYILRERTAWFALGLGAANTSDFTVDFLNGKYSNIWSAVGTELTITTVLLETGLLGTLLFLTFLVMVMRDGVVIAKTNQSGTKSALAAGVAGITLMFIVSLFYKNFIAFNAIGYLFWFFAGLAVSNSSRSRGPRPAFRPTPIN